MAGHPTYHVNMIKLKTQNYKHCKFTGTVLWYYHRAWVTCGVTIGLRVKSGYTFHALPLFYLRVQKFTCVRMYK